MAEIVVPTEGRPTSVPKVELVGRDGNAFAIMGRVQDALRRAGASKSFCGAYINESTSGDYDHLLATAVAYLETCGWGLSDDLENDEDDFDPFALR